MGGVGWGLHGSCLGYLCNHFCKSENILKWPGLFNNIVNKRTWKDLQEFCSKFWGPDVCMLRKRSLILMQTPWSRPIPSFVSETYSIPYCCYKIIPSKKHRRPEGQESDLCPGSWLGSPSLWTKAGLLGNSRLVFHSSFKCEKSPQSHHLRS